jgi:hypothetical protein
MEELMRKITDMIALANSAVGEAKRRRLEARDAIAKDPSRYAEPLDQPSGWCVVTQKGFWPRKYHHRFEEARLRECIERGHNVILTVGLVANPDSPLKANNHVACVAVSEPGKISPDKLSIITVRVKLHAAQALSN